MSVVAEDVKSLLSRACEAVRERIDPDRIALARRRQADMLAGRESDSIPMMTGAYWPQREGWPDFDWYEQFHDPAVSLYMQLKGPVLSALGDGDDTPSVRADTGVINCMTVFGAEYTVPRHTKPIVCEYVDKGELREFEVPEDVSSLGVLPRMIEHMEHHKAVLIEQGLWGPVGLHHCDQQGPFDIAAQTRGHDLFVDLYEDPDFVHGLMDKCTDVYVKVSRLCKRISDEPMSGSGNAVGLWMDNGSVRMCGDSDILIGADLHREFAAPYQQRAFEAMGGGWLHYCGGAKDSGRCEGLHLHDVYASIDGLRGLNWTTGRDWLAEMRKLRALGVTHVGTVPRDGDETLDEYFRRALSPYESRTGMVFQHPGIRDDERERAMDAWREAQDDCFGR